MSDQQPTSEDPPVASSSSAAPPVIKFKFGVDPNLILNEPRKRPREVTYTYGGSKPAAPVKQEVYQEPAFVIEKGQKLIDAVKNAREDEYDDGRLLAPDFLQLPDRDDYPDYYSIIKTPLAIDEIEAKLHTGAYPSVRAVKVAIEHCFWNAKKYNQKGSTIFEDAKYLHKLVKRKYIELVGKDNEDGSGSDEETPASKKAKKAPDIWQTLKIKLDRVINKKAADLSGRWLSTEFMDVPSKEDYPDYHAVIKKPRAFETILAKLKAKTYSTPTAFVRDTDLIFSNAQHYNQEDSQIAMDAVEMKTLFHQLVDPIVKEFNAGGFDPAPLPTHPPKIKLKVAGSGQSKAGDDSKSNLVQAAVYQANQANQSLLSAVAAITGEDPDAQDEGDDQQGEDDHEAESSAPQSDAHFSANQHHNHNHDNHNQSTPQQPIRRNVSGGSQPPPASASSHPAQPTSAAPSTPGTSTPQHPNNSTSTVYRAPTSLPVAPIKPRPGPPVLSSFVVAPKPGNDKERLTLRNERGVRAHAITLREVAEVVDLRISLRDFVPPPTGEVAAVNGDSMDVDLNGSTLLQKPAAGADYKTYSLFVLFNGVPVDPLLNSAAKAHPPAPGSLGIEDDGTHSRSPPMHFRFSLGAMRGGGAGVVGSVEVVASWRDIDGVTGGVKGGGREVYEVVVRRG